MEHYIIDYMLREDKLKEISVKLFWSKIQINRNLMFPFSFKEIILKFLKCNSQLLGFIKLLCIFLNIFRIISWSGSISD